MPKIINGVTCRTREESLKHIIKQAKAGKIGPKANDQHGFDSCAYQYPSGNHCAVGCLFSAKQIKDIKIRQANGLSISYLASRSAIGKRNIEAVTGMSLTELKSLQSIHDRSLESSGGVQLARAKLIDYCEKELAELANV